MNTPYYQLRLIDGIIDMESNQVTYNNGHSAHVRMLH